MNFIKFSISYEYLYSPSSWLHSKNIQFKILLFWLHLIFLPYMSTQHIFIYSVILMYCYTCIYIPKKLKQFLCQMVIIFIVFILLNIQKSSKKIVGNYIRISAESMNCFSSKFIINKLGSLHVNQLNIYFPLSIVRLLGFSFIYLITIKLFLLTTRYEKIIYLVLRNQRGIVSYTFEYINFQAMSSLQFLKIILQEIEVINMTWINRNGIKNKNYLQTENLLLSWLIVKQFLLKIYKHTHSISDTLYSREIIYKY